VELAPPLLHDEGLPAALAWLVPRMAAQHGLAIDLRVEERANPVAEEHRNILFHAARELLLNVVKHGHTKSARVVLSVLPGEIRLEVADPGSGFDPRAPGNGSASFGLFHIRQRLEATGGSLIIDARPGSGTHVTATLPFEESESAAGSANPSGKATARSKRTRSRTLSKQKGRPTKSRRKAIEPYQAEDGVRKDV
jgi:signal transduction histidine kinase